MHAMQQRPWTSGEFVDVVAFSLAHEQHDKQWSNTIYIPPEYQVYPLASDQLLPPNFPGGGTYRIIWRGLAFMAGTISMYSRSFGGNGRESVGQGWGQKDG